MFHDVSYAFRKLLKTPGFTIVAILTLAIAVGSNVAIFSAVDAVLLHPLPYPHPEQLVSVGENFTHFNLSDIPASPPEIVEYKRLISSFSQLGYFSSNGYTLTGAGAPEPIPAMQISSSIFSMLKVAPVQGALFGEEAEKPGNDHIAVISTGLWKRRFGSDPGVIGRTLQLNGESYRIIGIIHPILQYRFTADVWTPLAFTAKQTDASSLGSQFLDVIGRLKPGISLEQARAELRTVEAAMEKKYPEVYQAQIGYSLTMSPLARKPGARLREPLFLLAAAVGAVLLIACANISNLVLARSILRRREISIRAALGASRSRIIRQLLTENLLLSLAGGTAGVLLAFYGIDLYSRFGPDGLIAGTQPALNLWVLAFSLGLSVLASVIFGLAPALESSRSDLQSTLKEGARGASSGRRLLRESMMAAEVAVSLVLLIACGLLIRSFVRLTGGDPGFRAQNILTGTVVLPTAQYKSDAERAEFGRAFLEKLRALPGVNAASAIDLMPFSANYSARDIEIADHPRGPNEPSPVVIASVTDPAYFGVMGISVLRGRGLTAADQASSLPVAVIDATVARKFFPTIDPLGQRITGPKDKVNYTIVGVVGAIKFRDLSSAPEPVVYYSSAQSPLIFMNIAIKTQGDPLALISAVRAQLTSIDPNLPIARPASEERRLAESLRLQRFSIQLMLVFAGIASILAAIGIYGVLSYLVQQRRREFGIRIALGARVSDVVMLVLRQGSIPIAAGSAVGLASALALTRFLKSLLYETTPNDPLVFASITAGLLVVATVAILLPARRAARVDPVRSIHED